ncbi:MAG: hypothetical protein N2C14_00815 [Planctomycetales bacterium]
MSATHLHNLKFSPAGELDSADFPKSARADGVRPVLIQTPDLKARQAPLIEDGLEKSPESEPLVTEGVPASGSGSPEASGQETSPRESVRVAPPWREFCLELLRQGKQRWSDLRVNGLRVDPRLLSPKAIGISSAAVLVLIISGSMLFSGNGDQVSETTTPQPAADTGEADAPLVQFPPEAETKPTMVTAIPGKARTMPAANPTKPANPMNPLAVAPRKQPVHSNRAQGSTPDAGLSAAHAPLVSSGPPRQPGVARFKGYIESVTPTVEVGREPNRPGIH